MIDLKRFVPKPVRYCLFGAFLLSGPVVAMNAYIENKLTNVQASNAGLVDTYLAWVISGNQDPAPLKPLFDKAENGNAMAIFLLAIAQTETTAPVSLDEALIGFYRNAPDYQLDFILNLESIYNPEKRQPGQPIATSLTVDQQHALTECAARLRDTANRYKHMYSRIEDPLSNLLKGQMARANVLIDDTGLRQPVCGDLQV